LGADSHVCTFGALNIFSTGVGASDAAITLASGKNWFKVPETIQIIINGSLKKGVYAKDVILTIVKDFGIDGAAYKAIEFRGEAVEKFSVDSRFTLSNMVVEMGAKCGIMDADKKTADWLKRHSERKPVPVKADSDARYCQIREYDITDLSPRVACPDSPDNVTEVEEVAGRKVDQVFIGSCANGRYEDLEVASKILKNRKVAEGLKLMITPASQGIYKAALKKGLIEIFIKAGAIVNNPGCGPCVGTHQGVPADSEVIFSTSNRNYKGRMGNPEARIYLGSPATAAATAVKGVISDPREHKRRL
jgi:3-isopropylmalate/(R)-2-methylmalate dehydratase large subunit